MIGPRLAILTFFADITRWNTSCCGIEPIMIVMAAPIQNSQPCSVGSGKKLNRSFWAA